jgi:ABC-type spermidine/putrescine transport system permease subunit II
MTRGQSQFVLVRVCGAFALCLLLLPIIVLVGVSLNAGVEQVFPPHGISLRWYYNLSNRNGFIAAAQFSILLALGASVVTVFAGVCTAVALTRFKFYLKDVVLTLVLSPLIVPEVVIGMSFLVTLSSLGIFSSVISLSILHCVITLPYTARVILSGLSGMALSLEEAAQSLGARPLRAFVDITIPQIAPSLVAGGIFAFVTSFENFTASQFLVWDHTTLPVAIYTSVQTEDDPTAAALSSLIVITIVLLTAIFNRFVARHMLAGR